MAQGSIHGRFVWQELMTADTAAAAAFYSKVVGWHTMPSAADPSYTQFGKGGGYYAGMVKLPAEPAGGKPHWLPYVGVNDVEATAADAERHGGRIKKPGADIPTIGRFAILSDPQGAAFAIFKPAQSGMDAPNQTPALGSFSWMELATTQPEAALDFYAKLFGWQAVNRMDMGPQGIYLIFGSDGVQRGGIYRMHTERSSTPYWLPYASVASADEAAASAQAAGGHLLAGPLDVPGGGRIAQFTDPSGAIFAVHSVATAKPAPKPAAPKPKPAAAPKPAEAKPAAAPTAASPPAVPKPAAPKPAAPTPAAPKPAAPKPAVAKPAAKKKAAPKKKAAAKKKPAARKKAARKSAARSAKKAARKSAARRKPAKRAKAAKRRGGKARRKK